MSIGTEQRMEPPAADQPQEHGFSRTKRFVRSYPSLTVFLVAFAVRIIVVAGIAVFIGGLGVFGDDILYNRMAMQAAAGDTAGWGRRVQTLYWGTAGFMLPLTGLYGLFGPVSWIGQSLVAFFGAATAGLTTRVAMKTDMGTRWAIFAGLVVAFVPSQVLFSTLTLKDAMVWAVLAALGVIVAVANQADSKRLLGYGIAMLVLLVVMRYLRVHTLIVCVWAIAMAVWFGTQRQRLVRVAGAFLVMLLVPLFFGLGPAGLRYVASAGSLEERRVANAENANTAFIATGEDPAGSTSGSSGEVADGGDGDGDGGSDVATGGNDGGDVTTDDSDSAGDIGQDGAGTAGDTDAGPEGVVGDITHLPYGLAVMLAGPFPWWDFGTSRLSLAQWAMVIWYPVVALAAFGVPAVWRNRRALAYPVLVGGGMLLLYALAEGNFGTAYRHRGEFIWVIALLAALGLKNVYGWIRSRRPAE